MRTPVVFAALLLPMSLIGHTIVWQDEFNQPAGTGPDATKWVHDLGDNGWGNKELQTYTSSRENSFVVADPDATDGHALRVDSIACGAF